MNFIYYIHILNTSNQIEIMIATLKEEVEAISIVP